jgi:hypothetical protein
MGLSPHLSLILEFAKNFAAELGVNLQSIGS